ncbi:unnamed protein product, partial [Heterosigma akashiwo]
MEKSTELPSASTRSKHAAARRRKKKLPKKRGAPAPFNPRGRWEELDENKQPEDEGVEIGAPNEEERRKRAEESIKAENDLALYFEIEELSSILQEFSSQIATAQTPSSQAPGPFLKEILCDVI